MGEGPNSKQYDLEERTAQFAKAVRAFVRRLPHTIANMEDVRQLVRASGSVPANYIEANESLGKKDFQMHIKICRKESKECRLFLDLVDTRADAGLDDHRHDLMTEATEFIRIFSAILRNSGS